MVSSGTDKQQGLGVVWRAASWRAQSWKGKPLTSHSHFRAQGDVEFFLLLQCKITEDFESKDITL